MSTNIFAYSNKGCELAKKLINILPEADCYTTEKLAPLYGFNAEKSVCKKSGGCYEADNSCWSAIFRQDIRHSKVD